MGQTYAAELWCSNKGLDNDDCITGSDHSTHEDAAAALEALKADPAFRNQWAYACVEGPGGRSHVETRKLKAVADEDASEAMMAGMAFGVDAYNEAQGFYVEAPEDDAGYGL